MLHVIGHVANTWGAAQPAASTISIRGALGGRDGREARRKSSNHALTVEIGIRIIFIVLPTFMYNAKDRDGRSSTPLRRPTRVGRPRRAKGRPPGRAPKARVDRLRSYK